MSNEAEREAFEAWCDDQCFHAQTEGRAAFQAGAEWQRTQAQPADALVEALEDAIHSMLDCGYSKSSAVVIRKGTDALATYRAALEQWSGSFSGKPA